MDKDRFVRFIRETFGDLDERIFLKCQIGDDRVVLPDPNPDKESMSIYELDRADEIPVNPVSMTARTLDFKTVSGLQEASIFICQMMDRQNCRSSIWGIFPFAVIFDLVKLNPFEATDRFLKLRKAGFLTLSGYDEETVFEFLGEKVEVEESEICESSFLGEEVIYSDDDVLLKMNEAVAVVESIKDKEISLGITVKKLILRIGWLKIVAYSKPDLSENISSGDRVKVKLWIYGNVVRCYVSPFAKSIAKKREEVIESSVTKGALPPFNLANAMAYVLDMYGIIGFEMLNQQSDVFKKFLPVFETDVYADAWRNLFIQLEDDRWNVSRYRAVPVSDTALWVKVWEKLKRKFYNGISFPLVTRLFTDERDLAMADVLNSLTRGFPLYLSVGEFELNGVRYFNASVFIRNPVTSKFEWLGRLPPLVSSALWKKMSDGKIPKVSFWGYDYHRLNSDERLFVRIEEDGGEVLDRYNSALEDLFIYIELELPSRVYFEISFLFSTDPDVLVRRFNEVVKAMREHELLTILWYYRNLLHEFGSLERYYWVSPLLDVFSPENVWSESGSFVFKLEDYSVKIENIPIGEEFSVVMNRDEVSIAWNGEVIGTFGFYESEVLKKLLASGEKLKAVLVEKVQSEVYGYGDRVWVKVKRSGD